MEGSAGEGSSSTAQPGWREDLRRGLKLSSWPKSQNGPSPLTLGVDCWLTLPLFSTSAMGRGWGTQAASLTQVPPASFFSPSHLLLVLFNFLQAFGSLISLYPSEPSPVIPMTGGDIGHFSVREQSWVDTPSSALPPLWPLWGLSQWHLFFLSLFNFWLPGFLFLIMCGIHFT